MCDAGHTVDPVELFAMRKNNRNGHPYQCVCDIRHTVHSDELCAIRECKRNGQPDQGVCDIRHTVHSDELFSIRTPTETVQLNKMCVICGICYQPK